MDLLDSFSPESEPLGAEDVTYKDASYSDLHRTLSWPQKEHERASQRHQHHQPTKQ